MSLPHSDLSLVFQSVGVRFKFPSWIYRPFLTCAQPTSPASCLVVADLSSHSSLSQLSACRPHCALRCLYVLHMTSSLFWMPFLLFSLRGSCRTPPSTRGCMLIFVQHLSRKIIILNTRTIPYCLSWLLDYKVWRNSSFWYSQNLRQCLTCSST